MISEVDIRDWDRLPEGRRLADNHVGWGIQRLGEKGWEWYGAPMVWLRDAINTCNQLRLIYGKDYEFRVYEVVK